ncbi:MAG: S-layer homology domain-containing protein [Syntrophomonadaceae bacterium]|nr:S-layer homology domain-containing protein [Syntrophomonadaceae bacterium]
MRDHKPYRRILAMAMSIIITLGILPVAAAAEEPPIEASGEIISFAALPEKTANQTVPLGTSLEELNLPVTVTATVYAAAALDTEALEQDSGEPGRQESEQTDQSIPVTWASAPDYDGNAAGVYTFTPQIESFTLVNGLRPPQITVAVGIAAGEITAFAALSDDVRWQSVEYGTALEDLNLPRTLSGTVEGGLTEVPVTWASEPSYDEYAKGLYLLTAVPGEDFAAGAELPVIAVVVRGEAPRFNIFARGGGALDTDPFLIDSAAQLAAIAGIVNEGKLKTLFLGAGGSGQVYLKLENDIDLSSYASADSGKGWTPIGNDTNRFKGSFDGDNHTITGLTINRTGATFQGLFGYLDSGTMVHNLGIVGVNIIGGDENSGGIGGVAGYANGTVQNCYVTGSISGKTKTGGIVGQLGSSGVAQSCYSAANITGTFYVGGVAGGINGTVQNCYSTGSVSGTGYVGGVVGNGDAVQNCAALNPSVSLSSGTSIGRVVGSGSGFSGNIAFAGMKINGSTVSGGMGNDKSGADTTADTIGSDGSLGGLFTSTDGWTTANGKLPGFGAAVDMPAYLLGTVPFEGAGSSINPYRISTAAQLTRLTELVNAGTAPYANAGVCYRLENSLDLSGYASGEGWVPIGREDPYPFKGEFSGGGNQITGLYINRPGVALQGLFGQTGSGSVVENLGVVEASIVGQDLVGGVSGIVSGTVRNCYVTGSVSGRDNVGGVAGSIVSGAVQGCYTTAGVFGTQSGFGRAGGVAGLVHNSSLTNCAALNPSVGGGYEAGRVAGDALTGSCSGNIAFAGMTVTGDTSNAHSGEDTTADEIAAGTGLPDALKTAPWTYAPGKLPGLNGQTVDPPVYLMGDTPFVGSGESDAPFQISTAAQLARLAQLINEGNATYNANGVCYQLMNSLDLSGYAIADSGKGWTPIGTNANRFKGSFDGDNHIIAGLAINRPSANDQGLFGFIDTGGTVKNLGVTGISVVGNQFVGGMAGRAYGTVENCHSTGTISGYMLVGGVAGQVRGTVQGCYSSGSVTGSQGVAGGVAGAVDSGGRVHNCYATGNVTGGGTVGGVAGHVNGMVEDCYATGRVSATSSETGGVTGYVNGTVENCAALNVSVAGGSASAGRIAGSTSNPTLSGNIAFAGMTVNGSVASGGAANNQNGADTSAGAIAADGTLGGLFTAANGWTVEDGKLPGFGAAVDMPLHLISFSTTPLTVELSGTGISGSGTSYSAMTSPTDRTVTVTITGWADWTNKEVTVTAKKPDNSPLTVTPTDTVNGSATFTLPGGVEGTFTVTAAAKSNPVNVNKTVTLAVSTVTINSAAVNGVVAPAAGALPITLSSLTGGSNFSVTGLTWQNSNGSAAALTLEGKFKAGSAYKAVIELTAASGFKFPSGLTPGVDNGSAASGTVNGGDVGGNKLIFTVTFPATAAKAVTGVAVKTQPATLAYTAGEALDLAGLAATLTYNDGSTEDTSFADFGAVGLTVSPADGSALTMSNSNVAITHTASGKSAEQAITVHASPGGTGDSVDSGDGGGGGTTAPQYEAEVTGGGRSIETAVTVDTKTGRAAAELSSQELKNGADFVVTMPKIPGVTDYGLGIPTLNLSSGSGDGSLKLNTDAGSVTLPSDMLTGTGAASGNMAHISIGTVDPSGLTDSAQAAVGNRPVVSLSLYIDGKQTDWNNPAAPVTVSIPYTPASGEDQNAIVIWYIDGNGNLNCVINGRYDPETGAVTFRTTHFSLYAVGYHGVSFTDVPSASWYHDAVSYLAARGITSGTTATAFSPDATLTRGQFITLLLRAYGIEADKDAADNFSDAGGTYYTGYLAAAKRLGIANGVGGNRFSPEQAITRQQMFTLLYNALQALDRLPGSHSDQPLSNFSDSGNIAVYAREAMTYLVKAGIVSGSGGKLDPTGGSTRAQMAQVLYNLLEK